MSDDLREDFEKAFDEAEAQAQEETQHEESENTEAQRFAELGEQEYEAQENKPPAEVAEPAEKAEKPPEQAAENAPHETNETQAPNAEIKAPSSWNPKARETWKNVPPEAQAQIAKREKEIEGAMRASAESRQMVQQLNSTLEPFKGALMAQGFQNPFDAIQRLFTTEMQLRTGSAQNKAEMIARMIQGYGVDIGTLDSLLAGEQPQAAPQNHIADLIDQKLAPMNELLQQQQFARQQQAYQEQQAAAQTVEEFSRTAEFINDVRMDMADLLDLAEKNGRQMTIEQAYAAACQANPQVKAVLDQRAQQQQIMGTNNAVAQKKQAASASLTGLQGGSGSTSTNDLSLRDSIAQAWNDYQRV